MNDGGCRLRRNGEFGIVNSELAACGGCSWFFVLCSLFFVLCWALRGYSSTLAILAAWRELLDLNLNYQLELPLRGQLTLRR